MPTKKKKTIAPREDQIGRTAVVSKMLQTTKKTPRCQMCCGRCKRDAALVLRSGGKSVTYIDFGSLGRARTYVAPRKTFYACGKHWENLQRQADLYGGRVRPLSK